MTPTDQSPEGFVLHPVGTVKSELKKPVLGATKDGIEIKEDMDKIKQQHQQIKSLVSELEISPEFDGILEGIEDFSHIMVLYWPHLLAQERRSLRKVHPMGRKDLPEKGIFSTCSPARPNPVLVSTVRLLAREANTLRVQGLEAVDGSPIIDVKPFVRTLHGTENPSIPDWMKKIHAEFEAKDE
ncbi:MAG: tRNA (N6-threonylcarbamoyladenosine(37)-N6)-methyltransferase TrmO [Desulfobacterales bacterium]|nr:tRNA (N6-threonylcarbamoyladenosine(37)-N6)-methyltransferase TrmO [Desulfobacterales bacterium]